MLTETERKILHRAGEILHRECSSREGECTGCPLNNHNACFNIDIPEGLGEIGKALKKI